MTAVLAVLFTVVSWVLVRASRLPPKMRDPHGPRRSVPRWQDRVIDLGQVMPLLVVLALLSIAFVALIAWWATRRANQPLERALQVQRTFVADAAHELRTPLTTLNSRVQLAQHRLERGGDVSGALGDLRRDALAMDNVLTDLLLAAETAEVGAPPTRPTNVARAAGEALRLTGALAAERSVNVTAQVPPSLQVRADTTALTRALVALLDNAIRHSPPGGSVAVIAQLAASGKDVQIRVTDEGCGIDGDPERLFARFTREVRFAKEGGGDGRGFGLGLALVRDIASRFGGTITVESTAATGTAFLLTLPT